MCLRKTNIKSIWLFVILYINIAIEFNRTKTWKIYCFDNLQLHTVTNSIYNIVFKMQINNYTMIHYSFYKIQLSYFLKFILDSKESNCNMWIIENWRTVLPKVVFLNKWINIFFAKKIQNNESYNKVSIYSPLFVIILHYAQYR